ncbi:hypothetical protein K450DRAFT_236226 [Umbelopsis ramanniana AG]|uniref:DUF300-domain-containing protein n=1 Tax=Umbelopsis ramanniana AG TaxID=1314678 RepID=A0AAD5HDT9_UMBRA|nr:uncharacterized protein K450DRAFT_236226 [Umbelopsis ramanniana AG]KAI8580562.1 hypothetical protein K450DRAFT_236226 [Umbelopsis ramanniana AG]
MSLYRSINMVDGGGYGEGGSGEKLGGVAIFLAGTFVLIGTGISLISIWSHLKNYRKPNLQRQVIRILWMVPIYGISSIISLVSLNLAFYVDTFRDIYEAFVIYAFFNLLLNRLGGERALIIMLHSRPPSENFFPGTLYSREIYVGDPYTFLFVKRGILQFVYVKPFLAVLTMILKATDNYHDGEISWTSAYFYLTFFYNLSVCLSLWCLVVFFYATKKDLKDFRPLPKFLCVKAIIFFSFWQSVVIALLVAAGTIRDDGPEHIAVAIQDLLICLEMVPASIAHSFAFSYEDYLEPNVHSARMPLRYAVRDSVGIKDVIMDSLDTLRGDNFNYRAFEPSEGVPHIGSSRTSRIMAGLRYSTSTAKKHWLEPAPPSHYIASSVRGAPNSDGTHMWEEQEELEFEDPDPNEEIEKLYTSSRKMLFGDYNFPVIDFTAPLYRRGGSYGAVGQSNLASNPLLRPSISDMNKYRSSMETVLAQREGCVDVVVERGRGNYVLNYQGKNQRSLDKTMSPSKMKALAEAKRKSIDAPSTPRLRDSRPLTVAPQTRATSSQLVQNVDLVENSQSDNRNNRHPGSGAASPDPFDTASGNGSVNFGETSPFLDNNEENQNVWRNGWS